uniref:Uncharacterized protein n=1 Tax=Glossina austeni TaxID=7395 RepID=A0A1A9URF6_GLOAU
MVCLTIVTIDFPTWKTYSNEVNRKKEGSEGENLKLDSFQQQHLSKSVEHITKFIEGKLESLPEEGKAFKWPYKINSIFYLLADFYSKSRDFFKAIKRYILDLTISPVRFDSWAGSALSKTSKIETKLKGLYAISPVILWEECEEVLRCFECCHDSENLSMEKSYVNVDARPEVRLRITNTSPIMCIGRHIACRN